MLLYSLGQLLVQTRSVNPYRLATQGSCNCIVHSRDTRLVLEAPNDGLYADTASSRLLHHKVVFAALECHWNRQAHYIDFVSVSHRWE
jgi:hypothetical protein